MTIVLTAKEKLINLLNTGDLPNLIFADLKTYPWIMHDHKDLYDSEQAREIGVGGGNFTTALVCFTSIDLFGQLYNFIRKGVTPPSEQAEWEALLAENPTVKTKYDALLEKHYLGEDWYFLNHTNAFTKLIADSKIWTYDNEHLRKVWDSYRNSLSHMSFPKENVYGLEFKGESLNYAQYTAKIKALDLSPFEFNDNGDIICYHAILFRDTLKLKEWLITQISQCDDENKIVAINDWLISKYPKYVTELKD